DAKGAKKKCEFIVARASCSCRALHLKNKARAGMPVLRCATKVASAACASRRSFRLRFRASLVRPVIPVLEKEFFPAASEQERQARDPQGAAAGQHGRQGKAEEKSHAELCLILRLFKLLGGGNRLGIQ